MCSLVSSLSFQVSIPRRRLHSIYIGSIPNNSLIRSKAIKLTMVWVPNFKVRQFKERWKNAGV